MTSVTLWINPGERTVCDLPRVCMKCGAPATTVRKRIFSWYPPWVFFLILPGFWPFAIARLFLTKRQGVEVPFCDEHKNHWLIRVVVGIASFFILLGLGFVALVARLHDAESDFVNHDLLAFLFLGWFAVVVAWTIGFVVFNFLTTIRATYIVDRQITLTNV